MPDVSSTLIENARETNAPLSTTTAREPHGEKIADALEEERESPFVSVVIPCLNEEHFIGRVLENLSRQYPAEQYEIVIVDSMSHDRTREVISDFMTQHEEIRVRVLENQTRNIPASLNLGIREALGSVILRMDAHSVPSENYVRRCVELLSREDAAVVGMPCRIQPGAETQIAHAIAAAVAHPFGIGDAKYRMANLASTQSVDTVPFGTFRKELWKEVGGFNEELLANEDYDFYYRVRRRGGRILLDPSEHCKYFARPTFRELAKQYWRYGSWKAQMLKLHPRSVRWRHLVAPAFVSSLIITSGASFFWTPALLLLLLILAPYGALSLFFAAKLMRKNHHALSIVPLIVLAFLIVHLSWGSSFLLGLVRSPKR